MRKCIYLLTVLVCAGFFQANAAPGDTTWVQANNRRIDNGNGYGNYDTTVQFPTGTTSYRKVYMVFTLGEYPCPAGSQYCHQWDYTVQNMLMTATDTLELGRLITPYANTGVPRFPSTWSKDYVTDVTDYYPLLKNTATMRIFYSGYSAGFTANVRFAFIEGTPERNVTGVSRLWNGAYDYGNAADPIDNHITPKTKTAPANTQSAELKFMVTGHGSDVPQQCCEFASHSYSVKVNGTTTATKDIWRDDCGSNQLYPQGGTWIYERGNWCPGSIVNVNNHILPGITGGTNFNVDVDFQAYTNSAGGGYGSYITEGNLVFYGAFNRTLDASIEDVIAPSNSDNHFRENPSGDKPVIRIRNTGSSAITSVAISYNVKDSAAVSYTWNGNLAPLHDTIITLPALNTLTTMSLAGNTGLYQFVAQITAVNGAADNDATNNKLTSSFVVAPTWASSLLITMKTNSEGIGGVGVGVSETSWVITDMNNNIVASRTNAALSTIYADTVRLSAQGFYKFAVTDGSCDGLHWWVWDQNPGIGITAGSLTVKRLGFAPNLPMNGYTYTGSYAHDFGCGYSQYFTTVGNGVGISNVNNNGVDASIEAFPNPAGEQVQVVLYGMNQVKGELLVMNAVGQIVLRQAANQATNTLNLSTIASGVYNVIYADERAPRVQTRLVVAK